MAEAEWQDCERPFDALLSLLEGVTERKRLLFACACFRNQWGVIRYQSTASAIEAIEDYADDHISRPELGKAVIAASKVAYQIAEQDARNLAFAVASLGESRPFDAWIRVVMLHGRPRPAPLVRDVLGQARSSVPSRAFSETFLVRSLARAAYDERHLPGGELDPQRLAVLSDALEESGCDDAELLSHLRSPGPHVRGCWAIDLCLGLS